MVPDNRGLTEFGREWCTPSTTALIMVDLSHSGETDLPGGDSVRASQCRSTTPAAGHSPTCPATRPTRNCAWSPTSGGFVGIYFMPFLNPTGSGPRRRRRRAHRARRQRVRRGPRRHRHGRAGHRGSTTSTRTGATLAEHVALARGRGCRRGRRTCGHVPIRPRPARRRPIPHADPAARAARPQVRSESRRSSAATSSTMRLESGGSDINERPPLHRRPDPGHPDPDPAARRRPTAALEGKLPSAVNPPTGCGFTRCPLAHEQCAAQDPPPRSLGNGHVDTGHFPLHSCCR